MVNIPVTLNRNKTITIKYVAAAPPPPVYTCPTCGATFSTQAALDAHIAAAHPPPPTKATLTVKSTPVTTHVWIDGITFGVTPATRDVDPKTWTLRFDPVAGYTTPAPITVTLVAGETRTVTGTFVALPPPPPESFYYKCVWCGETQTVMVGVNFKCAKCGLSHTWTAETLTCKFGCGYVGRLMVAYIYGSKTNICPKCSRGWGV